MPPTLLNSCARAATAAEASFRIDRPIPGRSARVLALDDGAAEIVGRVAERSWGGTRFFTPADGEPADVEPTGGEGNGAGPDLAVRALDGSRCRLSDELADADVAILIATADDGAGLAATIARACAQRGVMTAGLILGDERETGAAVSALRPYAPVLLVTDDEADLSEVLTALRA
jgi:hypothetical protein